MKKLSIEEKAKAYDEALERAKKLGTSEMPLDPKRSIGEQVFPELKESEDEKTRKALLQFLNAHIGCSIAPAFCTQDIIKWIAWVEKQGEKPNNVYDKELSEILGRVICRYINDSNIPYTEREKVSMEIIPYVERLEKQGEQKLSDNVEQILKVRDWIINNDKRIAEPIQILKIEKYGYITSSGYTSFDKVKRDYHPWTIQDAEDGDVLAFYSKYRGNNMVQVGIIEKYVGKHGGCSNTFKIYVGVNWDNNLQIGEYMGCSDIRPATKKQCDTLFKIMLEAGYEWDANKMELKKIEQKSAWSEEDEYQINTILHGLDLKRELYKKEGNQVEEKRYKTQYDWLKSMKPQQNQYDKGFNDGYSAAKYNQWKPSRGQMKALNWIAHNYLLMDKETEENLQSLYNDLKTFES